ncbi:hypothetical protein CCAX7_56540 [Capsulimonas corticalis]|uniref:Ice-binding protein C-terminal domain-containing protein n=1 Tax=Capsulimonas corticalis TaxID=2219043 RepID=A0A402D0N5_9BACT|nr:PEP-CTERM sorting domain-containing protein [Capsulimonas corticalis]BDI33603.1 hypothetical protein CCAX7_56540 [Capsulimonas corticalis]
MTTINKTGAALVLALTCAFTPLAAHANLVRNGGFETGNFTNWTILGDPRFIGVDGGSDARSGAYGAYFGALGSDTTITQLIPTTPGKEYSFQFDLKNDGGVHNDFSVFFGGRALIKMVDANGFSFTHYYFNETASDPFTAIQFSGRQDPAYYELDNVSVTPASTVPEPNSLAALGVGAVCIGAAALRRKRRSNR